MMTRMTSTIVAVCLLPLSVVAMEPGQGNATQHPPIDRDQQERREKIVDYEISDLGEEELTANESHALLFGSKAKPVGDCNVSNYAEERNPFVPGKVHSLVPITTIINTGLRIWKIIEANKPVSVHESMMANALPHGAECWTSLWGWNPQPKAKRYRVRYKNMLGSTVVDFQFRLLFIYGGTDGYGKYMARMSFEPKMIHVKWGQKFHAIGKVNAIYNVSKNRRKPLAAAEMSLQWTVKNTFNKIDMKEHFYIDADGTIQHLKN